MKAIMPKCYDQLKPSEKARIEACCILYDMGVPKDDILMFIGGWKRLYRANSRFKDKAEQAAFLDPRMEQIFGEGGFPEEYVQSFRDIGR